MTNNTSLIILSTAIRQDAQGRYCLNDCHKASGGEPGKRPGEWLRNDQAQALVAELTDAENPASPVSSVKGGSNQGTYGSEELILAYAQWISPAFHVQCLRALLAMMKGEAPATQQPSLNDRQSKAISILRIAEDEAAAFIRKRVNDAVLVMQGHEDLVTVPTLSGKVTPKQMREAVGLFRSLQYVNKLSGMDKNNALLSANRQVKETTGIDLLKNSGATHLLAHETDHPLTPTAIGKRLGNHGPQRINGVLSYLGFQTKKSIGKADAWVPTSKGEPYAVMEDTNKKHSDGTPVRQLKWKASIVPLIEQEVNAPRPFAKKPEGVS
ncbi:KilA-N domain-containing protein [Gluconobacter frateurii]|uniref:KilA-N domain-containing protein n=1 Tax=Gluconobacter frateurii NRIC 0228 TaxID=1307946 RepID=A0ABQ0QED3_9PROT|nr:KilA-N domain-containing protein [Gluconobacter frateurii]GBR15565.1 hypothetical protein AA0228_2547 [Gluconobacter frateurii NRIC 0228]GLP90343.1 hypothetical protein GCM10007868_14180 [Gluconobacter frateurii]